MNKPVTDLQVARQFFDMLKNNGVTIKEEDEGNCISFTICDHCWEDCTATEFSFFKEDELSNGEYWRIDGAVNGGPASGFNKNKIHVQGWK